MIQFDKIYVSLLNQIFNEGYDQLNERSGFVCKAIPGAHFSIDLAKGFPLLSLRKLPLKIFIAEQMWFIMGENDPAWLRPYTKIWDSFIEEDGKVTSYGYRWRKHFGRDQLGELIKMLKNNPGSRQGVVIAWDPKVDGLTSRPKKNVPCLFSFTVNVIGGRLCMHNIIRSEDMFLGFPHDVAGFAFLQMMLAQELSLPVGTYSHSISNCHLYSDQYDAAKSLMNRKNTKQKEIILKLPDDSLNRAAKGDTKLIEEIYYQLKDQYFPLDAISGIKAH